VKFIPGHSQHIDHVRIVTRYAVAIIVCSSLGSCPRVMIHRGASVERSVRISNPGIAPAVIVVAVAVVRPPMNVLGRPGESDRFEPLQSIGVQTLVGLDDDHGRLLAVSVQDDPCKSFVLHPLSFHPSPQFGIVLVAFGNQAVWCATRGKSETKTMDETWGIEENNALDCFPSSTQETSYDRPTLLTAVPLFVTRRGAVSRQSSEKEEYTTRARRKR
jgi:hypothetical protein